MFIFCFRSTSVQGLSPWTLLGVGATKDPNCSTEVADNHLFRTKYEFTFDDMFEIHDEFEILRKMGMCYGLDQGNYNDETLQQAEALLPNTARPYLKGEERGEIVCFLSMRGSI